MFPFGSFDLSSFFQILLLFCPIHFKSQCTLRVFAAIRYKPTFNGDCTSGWEGKKNLSLFLKFLIYRRLSEMLATNTIWICCDWPSLAVTLSLLFENHSSILILILSQSLTVQTISFHCLVQLSSSLIHQNVPVLFAFHMQQSCILCTEFNLNCSIADAEEKKVHFFFVLLFLFPLFTYKAFEVLFEFSVDFFLLFCSLDLNSPTLTGRCSNSLT